MTITFMDNQLGAYLRQWRERRGMTLTAAAAEMGIGKGYLSQIETGKLKWPNADVRRRIAEVIGMSHVDLLIKLGELLPSELEAAGKQGIVHQGAELPSAKIHALVDRVNWYGREDRVSGVTSILTAWADADAHYKEIV
jgi:transcriptional regulator with XRE-family HTH domain